MSSPSGEILWALDRILLRRVFVESWEKLLNALFEQGGGFKVHRHVFGDGEDLPGFGVADFFGGAHFFSEGAETAEGDVVAFRQSLGDALGKRAEEGGGFFLGEEEFLG